MIVKRDYTRGPLGKLETYLVVDRVKHPLAMSTPGLIPPRLDLPSRPAEVGDAGPVAGHLPGHFGEFFRSSQDFLNVAVSAVR